MLGKQSPLCTPHDLYTRLGDTQSLRQIKYRSLFADLADEVLVAEIRENTNKGLALGNQQFKAQLEALTGRRMLPAKMGRPKKSLL